jgi:hypothetical protein
VKKLQLLLIVGLVVAVGIAYKYLREIESELPDPNPRVVAAPIGVVAKVAASPTPILNPRHIREFSELIHKESEAMSRLTDHPEEVQRRLKDLAAQMQEEQVLILKEKALNMSLEGDERFISVYVLGESKLDKAQESLEQIAVAPIPKLKESRMNTQEEIIRGQAIESIQEPEPLRRVLAHTDNKFLTDRAQRTLAFREGKVPSAPEKQDQEALKKILDKPTQ